MSKPAALSRVDVAKSLSIKLISVTFSILLLGVLLLPEVFIALVYGLVIYNVNYVLFMLYAFRYSGSRSSYLMLQSISKAIFVKLLFFALALVVIFRFDSHMLEPLQAASILASYMLMQVFQFGFSVNLARKL